MVSKLYSQEILAHAVASSDSLAGVMKFLGKSVTGSRYNYLSRLVKQYGLDTSHFTYSKAHREQESFKRKAPEDILVMISDPLAKRVEAKYLTRAMMELGVVYECSECGISDWQGKPLVLDVDHVDGNRFDCRLSNLRFLCPNCHRQTPTFGRQKRVDGSSLVCACGLAKQKRSKSCASCYANRVRN
jgi:hypothetical protein